MELGYLCAGTAANDNPSLLRMTRKISSTSLATPCNSPPPATSQAGRQCNITSPHLRHPHLQIALSTAS
jgi:hypothetical protein